MPTKTIKEYARGQECQIRLPGCLPDNETVCLCHLRTPITGLSKKEHDLQGAHGCHSCHSVVDGRSPLPDGWSREDIEIAFYEAIYRTQRKVFAAIGHGLVRARF